MVLWIELRKLKKDTLLTKFEKQFKIEIVTKLDVKRFIKLSCPCSDMQGSLLMRRPVQRKYAAKAAHGPRRE